ncbi:heme ABC transporter ATPase [Luteitalea sp. TBR-22]|uniref:ATP-binding cassette domain-containing protein n=1 Tax=Luteitalea sp. TBR-22 TaxID=2802971 RepID=UPI001AF5065B|nr:ATP-binding cassette domain-containing protein [Luteitalea sp. TBR-22]BCS34301.1 heme ABC transporter ATPase [Luteitalea sp. TBR-22]
MALIELDDVTVAFGHRPLLDRSTLRLEAGERVCLIGRNGEGKSTLLRIVAGDLPADGGRVWRQPGLRIARLEQDVPPGGDRSVFAVVAEGLGALGELATEYHQVAHEVAEHGTAALIERLGHLQEALERQDGWRLEQRVEDVVHRLDLPADAPVNTLSGGQRRRVLLAQALVRQPDVLLLDEPTNHLDIDSIEWLEGFLREFAGALLFVTHDRALLRSLATRIVELDRGSLRSYPGDYDAYLATREAEQEAEAQSEAKFDKLLAREEAWIRQGIKARRTRDEGRVRALEAMRRERAQRREKSGTVQLAIDDSERSGAVVLEARHLAHRYGDRVIVRDFSGRIMRGDRVGILGPNGAGKTTLLRLLLGTLPVQSGEVVRGTNLEIAYFDQEREQLDPDATVMDTVADGRQMVDVPGGGTRHVAGYLKEFLFTPERFQSPVRALSGGERNRLLLARLLVRPANVLVLDEPTNDLDLETLDVLEDLLLGFAGTLLVVSHDRAFLDRVVTSTIAFEGDGVVREYVGGYTDWVRQKAAQAPAAAASTASVARDTRAASKAEAAAARAAKLTYKEKIELEALPATIEALEARKAELEAAINAPDFHRRGAIGMAEVAGALEATEAELEATMARWLDLEGRAEAAR